MGPKPITNVLKRETQSTNTNKHLGHGVITGSFIYSVHILRGTRCWEDSQGLVLLKLTVWRGDGLFSKDSKEFIIVMGTRLGSCRLLGFNWGV